MFKYLIAMCTFWLGFITSSFPADMIYRRLFLFMELNSSVVLVISKCLHYKRIVNGSRFIVISGGSHNFLIVPIRFFKCSAIVLHWFFSLLSKRHFIYSHAKMPRQVINSKLIHLLMCCCSSLIQDFIIIWLVNYSWMKFTLWDNGFGS